MWAARRKVFHVPGGFGLLHASANGGLEAVLRANRRNRALGGQKLGWTHAALRRTRLREPILLLQQALLCLDAISRSSFDFFCDVVPLDLELRAQQPLPFCDSSPEPNGSRKNNSPVLTVPAPPELRLRTRESLGPINRVN